MQFFSTPAPLLGLGNYWLFFNRVPVKIDTKPEGHGMNYGGKPQIIFPTISGSLAYMNVKFPAMSVIKAVMSMIVKNTSVPTLII